MLWIYLRKLPQSDAKEWYAVIEMETERNWNEYPSIKADSLVSGKYVFYYLPWARSLFKDSFFHIWGIYRIGNRKLKTCFSCNMSNFPRTDSHFCVQVSKPPSICQSIKSFLKYINSHLHRLNKRHWRLLVLVSLHQILWDKTSWNSFDGRTRRLKKKVSCRTTTNMIFFDAELNKAWIGRIQLMQILMRLPFYKMACL